jgi:uncharacterized protein YegL
MQTVIPVYIAIDSSASMQLHVDDVESAIARLRDELLMNPVLADQVRVGIISFSDRAELLVPLTDLTASTHLPRLRTHGSTAWGPLFELLTKVITQDLRLLRSQGARIARPQVFMISDGPPMDPWESSFANFVDATGARLSFIAIGFGRDAGALLTQMAPAAVVTTEAGDGPGDARAIAWPLISSLRPLVGSYLATRDPDSGLLRASRSSEELYGRGRY